MQLITNTPEKCVFASKMSESLANAIRRSSYMVPIMAIDELAIEMKGKIKIVKINIDENPKTPLKYGVQGIPTLIIFKAPNEGL